MSTDPAVPTPDRAAEALFGGRYELQEQIGRGGMSTVYRGRDRALGRLVAVKVIRHDPVAGHDRDNLRERFRREAANVARIPPHPNVVQIYDYGTDPDGYRDFIIMELLAGRDLKAALKERRFGTDEALRILLQAARGLAAGHRVGIVHRDVKPANILLTGEHADGPVKILDFGIAKALEGDPEDDLTQLGGVPHTPSYASPEQLSAIRTLSPASDVYQLGLVAYELLAGEKPFDPQDRERMRAGEQVPLPSRGRWNEVPLPLRAVVERALHRDLAGRFADGQAFAGALAHAGDDDGTLLATAVPGDSTAAAGIDIPHAGEHRAPPAPSIPDRWRALPKQARAAMMIVLGLLLLFLVFRGRGGDAPAADPVMQTLETTELEEKFAPLYGEAAERLAEERE